MLTALVVRTGVDDLAMLQMYASNAQMTRPEVLECCNPSESWGPLGRNPIVERMDPSFRWGYTVLMGLLFL